MVARLVQELVLLSLAVLALGGCAPGDAPLEGGGAAHHESAVDACPASLQTVRGHDAWTIVDQGARYRVEAFVLEGIAAVAASDADRSCFLPWVKFLWAVAGNGLGATVLEPMIAAGLDPNLTDIDVEPLCAGCTGTRSGETTLHHATTQKRSHDGSGLSTASERVTMVRVLLENGADPNLVCAGSLWGGGNHVGSAAIGGATPLMFTASWDDHGAAVEAAQLLLDASADVNVRALSVVRSRYESDEVESGETALAIARQHGNTALVEHLLAAGAIDWDLDAEVQAAKAPSAEEVAEILTNKQVEHDRVWSLWFDERAHRTPIQHLLDGGLDPSARTWGGKYTPLMATVFQTGVYAALPPDDLRAIVAAGAPLDDPGSIGLPPLVVVIDQYAHWGYLEVLKLLLEAGADVEGRAADGDTPLLRLMYTQRGPEVQALLLAAGADPNAANHAGQRPLSVAVRAPKPLPMIDALLAHGADLNADVDGAPLWAYALGRNPLYVSEQYHAQVAPILDRFVHHPSLDIDLSFPSVQSALQRADSNPLVKPFADVIRARAGCGGSCE